MCGFYIGSGWDIYFYKLNQYLEDDLMIVIYDVYGKLVHKKKVPGNYKNIELNISDLNTGMHIVVLSLDGRVISSGKFIVNNK